MQSVHVLTKGIKPTSYQKLLELFRGTEFRVVYFTGAQKQFFVFAISLVYDKSHQHRSIYDSYNVELASTKIKSIPLENASNTSSTFNSLKFDTDDSHNKFLLYNQFVVWYCKSRVKWSHLGQLLSNKQKMNFHSLVYSYFKICNYKKGTM